MAIRLILNSSSMVPGYDQFLGHAEPYVRDLFSGCTTIGFVPYAQVDHDGYTRMVCQRFTDMGLDVRQIENPSQIKEVDGIFIGGGNTFLLTRELHLRGMIEPIRSAVLGGIPYLGSSAGSNVACPTLCTTNDMPIVWPVSFDTLGLVDFQINAHYLDDKAFEGHNGETRTQRILEYHEHNERPVIALREGSLLAINDREIQHLGLKPARVFRRGLEPYEVEPDSFLNI